MAIPPAATAFHCFPDLPAEIRDAIWEECIPPRVVDLDRPNMHAQLSDLVQVDTEVHGPRCDWTRWKSPQLKTHVRQPPRIAHVCREARAVAWRYGPRHLRLGRGGTKLGKVPMIWLDPGRDVLNLHWFWGRYDDGEPYPLRYEDAELLRAAIGSPAKHISLTYNVCSMGMIRSYEGVEYLHKLLAPRSSYYVSLGTIVIHIGAGAHKGKPQEEKDACIVNSGLFGLFGEARVQQVGAGDFPRLARYAAFNREHGAPDDFKPMKFFNNYATYDLPKAMNMLKVGWIESHQGEAKSMGQESGGQVFIWRTVNPEGAPEGPQQEVTGPNYDNPWVSKVLQTMPEYHPVWTVRVCTDDCTLPGPDLEDEAGLVQWNAARWSFGFYAAAT